MFLLFQGPFFIDSKMAIFKKESPFQNHRSNDTNSVVTSYPCTFGGTRISKPLNHLSFGVSILVFRGVCVCASLCCACSTVKLVPGTRNLSWMTSPQSFYRKNAGNHQTSIYFWNWLILAFQEQSNLKDLTPANYRIVIYSWCFCTGFARFVLLTFFRGQVGGSIFPKKGWKQRLFETNT